MILFLTLLCLLGCNTSNSLYSIPESGYTTVNHIDNLAFCVPSFVANKATAITKIANDQEYESNVAYSYKNGSDEYIMFCIDQLVVLAQKGTDFDFASTEQKEDCLNNSGVLNTWFSKCSDNDKFVFEDSLDENTYKIISEVSAEVVITTQLYGDFIGKLAVISTDNEEWSLFAGVMGDSFKNLSQEQIDFINGIVKSMRLEANPVEEVPTYDIVLESNPLNDDTDENEPETEESYEQSTEPMSNDNAVIEETIIVSSNEITDTSSDSSNVKSDKVQYGINVTNQKIKKNIFDNAYESDEYSMLNLKECGILSAKNSIGKYENPIIRINTVYSGKQAQSIIKTFFSETGTDFFEAPPGYSWQVANYDVSYASCTEELYINITVEGLDGNQLYFRGIPCPERTYDAKHKVRTDANGNYLNHYVFYAIPNGCKEYVLKCGEGDVSESNTLLAAYYHIHNTR